MYDRTLDGTVAVDLADGDVITIRGERVTVHTKSLRDGEAYETRFVLHTDRGEIECDFWARYRVVSSGDRSGRVYIDDGSE
jgi:hypothetical protein